MFATKIDAIKALRERLRAVTIDPSFTQVMVDGNVVLKVTNPHNGLKEAKDFIEDVMALGVKEAEASKESNERKVEQILSDYYNGRIGLAVAREAIMALEATAKL